LMQCLKWASKPDQLRPWFEVWRDGWKLDPWSENERHKKLSGRGVLRMARHGRPPVV
ncbi:glycosyltransferase family 2 protein, partial [Burkholderia multivorans]